MMAIVTYLTDLSPLYRSSTGNRRYQSQNSLSPGLFTGDHAYDTMFIRPVAK
jgi:hypothetical protein